MRQWKPGFQQTPNQGLRQVVLSGVLLVTEATTSVEVEGLEGHQKFLQGSKPKELRTCEERKRKDFS